MRLTNADLAELVDLRHELHRHPEVSGAEEGTARRVVAALGSAPDRVVAGLGGHGVAAVFEGAAPGPTVMIRSELDALPIEELSGADYRSESPGVGHLCGHDGHSVILIAVARALARERPARGRVVLMFQPAEEDGSGAAAVLADPAFADIRPDWAFALHNLPGLPLGAVVLEPGPCNCASRGLRIRLTGRTSHAAEPEAGVSPAQAMARLIPALAAVGPGGPSGPAFRLVTVTHARLGEPAHGISPGEAEIWATLRSETDAVMDELMAGAEAAARAAAEADGLGLAITVHDDFAASINDAEAAARLRAAAAAEGREIVAGDMPLRASEDFGRFGQVAKGAMFYLGAGERAPALHNPDYDFPDALIEPASRVFLRAIRDLLG
jgi:amidohydrolase